MQNNIDVLNLALTKLGVKVGSKIKIEGLSPISKVFLNNKYFGTFDYCKNKFIDLIIN
jgi:hypothetical protein